jgi:hypothetical protein
LDGHTIGPHCFSITIGKQMNGCEKLPTVDFVPIEASLPEIKSSNLSTDQAYLLDMLDPYQKNIISIC